MGKVRCADCGFLALREVQTGAILEAVYRLRTEWINERELALGRVRHERTPCCYRQALDFKAEVKAAMAGQLPEVKQEKVVLPIIQAERECDKFTPWLEDHTPKEHYEMLVNDRLQRELEDRRERERDRDQKFQLDMKSSEQKWQQEEHDRNRKWQLRLAYLAAAFALLNGLVGMLGGWLLQKQQSKEPIIIQMPADAKPAPKD